MSSLKHLPQDIDSRVLVSDFDLRQRSASSPDLGWDECHLGIFNSDY